MTRWRAATALALACAAAGDPTPPSLFSTDPLEREAARRALVAGGADALETLSATARADDARLREMSLWSLADLALPQSAAELSDQHDRIRTLAAGALRDPDVGVRCAALALLRSAQPTPPAALLAPHCDRTCHWSERRAAARALEAADDPTALALLERALADPDTDVRAAAFDSALGSRLAGAADLLAREFPLADSHARRRILIALALREHNASRGFLELAARDGDDAGDRVLAAAGLARAGVRTLDEPQRELLLSGVAAADPEVRDIALMALARQRQPFGADLLERLPHAEAGTADAIAEAAVALLAEDAYPLLLAIAAGERPASDAARAGAVRALRRFKSPRTTADLAWVYRPELPRALREELLGAYEDLPKSPGARSGLSELLHDPDSNLRLRAFRLLLELGASSLADVEWLMEWIAAEPQAWVQSRMSRLLAARARGDGARKFAHRLLSLLSAKEAWQNEARAALENLGDLDVAAEIGDAVAALQTSPPDLRTTFLLTRLPGQESDRLVARTLATARTSADPRAATDILIQLRTSGGPRSLAAVREALGDARTQIRIEALRTLLSRGDEYALDALERAFPALHSDTKSEFLELLGAFPEDRLASLFRFFLDFESDADVRDALVDRAGVLGLPVAERLIPLLDAARPADERIRACDALAEIGGAEAELALAELFDSTAEAQGDERLLLSLARAQARLGRIAAAPALARLLLSRSEKLERVQYKLDAGFPFEETLLLALLELGRTSGNSTAVAAALAAECERQRKLGRYGLLPKALFARFAKALAGAGPAYAALEFEWLDLALRLPPRGADLELRAALRLADRHADAGRHAHAAVLLDHALAMLAPDSPANGLVLREEVGPAAAGEGFHPRMHLAAAAELARALALAAAGDGTAAAAALDRTESLAPVDGRLHYEAARAAWFALGQRERALDRGRAAIACTGSDAQVLAAAARLLAELGDSDSVDRASGRLQRLRASGLAPDDAQQRLGMAEALALLGRAEEARSEIAAANRLDPESERRAHENSVLAPLFR